MEPVGSVLGIGASFMYNRYLRANYDNFRMALTKEFSQIFTTCNLGYNEFIYKIILIRAPLGDRVNYFVEDYNDTITNRIHIGFTWIPKKDIQLDINGGRMNADD
tara:strand:- start:479 stop:793 length:315 start_codon:yes stop_codon:yes gene_type:complete